MTLSGRAVRFARAVGLALGLAFTLGTTLALPRASLGHALLLASDPAAGTSVAASPAFVTLTFGEAPDTHLSRVRVLDTAGKDHVSGPVEAVAGAAAQLRVPLDPLPDGVYTVAWRAVSAVDGHASAGSFAFGVGAGAVVTAPNETAGGGAPTGSPLGVIARWLFYGGLALVLGASLVGSILHPRPPRRVASLAAVGWLAAAAGAIGVVAFQWLDSGAGLADFMGSSLSIAVLARAATLLVTGAAVWALWRRPNVTAARPLFALTMIAAAAALLVDVLAGHAAASSQPPFAIASQWLHGLSAGLWIGGLAALLVAVRGLPTEEKTRAVRRFSNVAAGFIAVLALSGLARALDQVGSLSALVGTDFGRLVIAKSAGMSALAGLGAFNRFINVPAAARSLRGLRRVGSVEVTTGALVFALTAALVNAPPPVAGGPSAPAVAPITATGTDFGTTVRLKLIVSPGTPGFNDFRATVNDFDSGAPAAAGTTLSLRFTLASPTGVGSSTLDLPATGPGTFEASGGNLSIDGIWRVTAQVAGGTGAGSAVEIPFVLATRVPAQQVVSDPSIQPIIYTVSLPGGDSAQVYLDPGRVGPDDLHITFFDAAGKELPVANVAMAVTRPDGPGELASPRQLEPGHFVASLTVPSSGTLWVDAAGPAPDGTVLHAYLAVEVAP